MYNIPSSNHSPYPRSSTSSSHTHPPWIAGTLELFKNFKNSSFKLFWHVAFGICTNLIFTTLCVDEKHMFHVLVYYATEVLSYEILSNFYNPFMKNCIILSILTLKNEKISFSVFCKVERQQIRYWWYSSTSL